MQASLKDQFHLESMDGNGDKMMLFHSLWKCQMSWTKLKKGIFLYNQKVLKPRPFLGSQPPATLTAQSPFSPGWAQHRISTPTVRTGGPVWTGPQKLYARPSNMPIPEGPTTYCLPCPLGPQPYLSPAEFPWPSRLGGPPCLWNIGEHSSLHCVCLMLPENTSLGLIYHLLLYFTY